MSFVTQISAATYKENKALFELKKKLGSSEITMPHLMSEKLASKENTAKANSQAVFSKYKDEINFYESVAGSDFHIVCNAAEHGYLDEDMSRQILYAMLKQKPIVLLRQPALKIGSQAFARQAIEKRQDMYYVRDLLKMSDKELQTFFANISGEFVDYELTQREEVLIRARVRAYFQELTRNQTKPVLPL